VCQICGISFFDLMTVPPVLQENNCNISKLFVVMDFTLKHRMARYTILHTCLISAHYYYYFGCYSIPHSFSQRVVVQCRHNGLADDCLTPAPCAYSYSFLGVIDGNI
jgi:hypothetical protein